MQIPSSHLYAVRECSDVFVDAALRDDAGDLLFLSIFGRDTAILQFFASFTLPVGNGGRDGFTLTRDDESHRVAVLEPNALDKLTGRLPRGNLFGNLTHAWLYKADAIKPDRSNRRALVLRFDESEEAFLTRLWLLTRDLCPVPLLDHWRKPLMEAMGEELVTPLSAGKAPPIGVVDGVRLALPEDFERVVSAGVILGALTLSADDMPADGAERLREVARQAREPAGSKATRLFELGSLVCTRGVDALVAQGRVNPAALLARHASGDWGICSDPEQNDAAVKQGERIFSVYPIDPDQPCQGYGENTVWVITEADRSATTLLLPDEY